MALLRIDIALFQANLQAVEFYDVAIIPNHLIVNTHSYLKKITTGIPLPKVEETIYNYK